MDFEPIIDGRPIIYESVSSSRRRFSNILSSAICMSLLCRRLAFDNSQISVRQPKILRPGTISQTCRSEALHLHLVPRPIIRLIFVNVYLFCQHCTIFIRKFETQISSYSSYSALWQFKPDVWNNNSENKRPPRLTCVAHLVAFWFAPKIQNLGYK